MMVVKLTQTRHNTMAYISADTVKRFRNEIKAAFPTSAGWKWSVTGKDHTKVIARLMAYPAGYNFPEYVDINYYYIERSDLGEKEKAVMTKVKEILFSEHWDESDPQIDYFNCAYYVTLGIGRWDKPAVVTPKKVKAKRAPRKAAPAVKATMSDREARDLAAFVGIQF